MKARTIALLALLACGCSKAPDERPVGGMTTLAEPSHHGAEWLSAVQQANLEAGVGSPEAKRRALDELRTLAVVPSTFSPEDAASMRRDILGSAARLALELDQPIDAWLLIREGLALPGSDPFRAQLLLLAVEAEHALGRDEGEAAAREAARRELGLN